jgi:hypothetical protein
MVPRVLATRNPSTTGNKQAKARRQGYEGNTNNTTTSNQQANNGAAQGQISQVKETTMKEGISHPKGRSQQ